jgi:hypothetical protein
LKKYNHILTYFIALVWLLNGLFCKVLNFVPRHQKIVGHFFGQDNAFVITRLIGVLEVGMALWVLSKYKEKWNMYVQIIIVLSMNILEFLFVPELLLWRQFNLLFALLFVGIIYFNGMNRKTT